MGDNREICDESCLRLDTYARDSYMSKQKNVSKVVGELKAEAREMDRIEGR